jgi:hypothetical protein
VLGGGDAVHHPEQERRHEHRPQRRTDAGVPKVERHKRSASHTLPWCNLDGQVLDGELGPENAEIVAIHAVV